MEERRRGGLRRSRARDARGSRDAAVDAMSKRAVLRVTIERERETAAGEDGDYHSRPTRPSWPCGVSSRSRIARRCQLSKGTKKGQQGSEPQRPGRGLEEERNVPVRPSDCNPATDDAVPDRTGAALALAVARQTAVALCPLERTLGRADASRRVCKRVTTSRQGIASALSRTRQRL